MKKDFKVLKSASWTKISLNRSEKDGRVRKKLT